MYILDTHCIYDVYIYIICVYFAYIHYIICIYTLYTLYNMRIYHIYIIYNMHIYFAAKRNKTLTYSLGKIHVCPNLSQDLKLE